MTTVRLCILDEQVLFRDCLVRMLESAGLVCTSQHSDAHAFLTALGADRPSIALLCIPPEGGEGLTVVEEAHQLHPDIRLLVLSATLEPDTMDRCFRAGAAGYLDKSSCRFEAVVDAIQAVACGNNVFPAHAVESLLRTSGRRNEGAELLRGLSDREREVLAYLSIGADNLQIASRLKISERTVKAHVSNLYRKLGQDNRTQLALLARQSGVRPPAPSVPRADASSGPVEMLRRS